MPPNTFSGKPGNRSDGRRLAEDVVFITSTELLLNRLSSQLREKRMVPLQAASVLASNVSRQVEGRWRWGVHDVELASKFTNFLIQNGSNICTSWVAFDLEDILGTVLLTSFYTRISAKMSIETNETIDSIMILLLALELLAHGPDWHVAVPLHWVALRLVTLTTLPVFVAL
jgi:hypothetical protein